MKIDRRRFLGFGAGAAVGVATGVPASRTLSDLIAAAEEPLRPPQGPEDFVLSVCGMCSGGCGLRVRRIGKRPVKVDGNPLHPVNGGRLCPRGLAALQSLYHPDRLAGPMQRIGPPGTLESFERATWEEALGAIVERLDLLRRVGRPESLALMYRDSRGIAVRLATRFLRAFGSPNEIGCERGEETARLALELTQGLRSEPIYDIGRTDYVLSFGGALLEAWSSPVHMMRAYGEFRQGRPGRRGKLVQIEPRLSITGGSADEWIGVRPGSEGVLALGIAEVLVAEGLYDRAFVSQRCLGIANDRDVQGLASLLEELYPLERVAAETGIPNHVILRLAREFAAARTRLAVGPRKGPLLPGALFDHLAVQTLNALVGNLDSAGGTLLPDQFEFGGWPPLPADPVAAQGLERPRLDGAGVARPRLHSDPEGLAEAVLQGPLYPLEVLLVLDADPAFSSAAPERFRQALERIPMVVSFSSVPDDTALMADWILPASHPLESWDLLTTPAGVAFPMVSLAQPALEEPLTDSRPASAVFLEIAARLGGPVAEALPWSDPRIAFEAEVESLYSAKRGTTMGTPFDEAWVRMMERAGWWAPGYRSLRELWELMRERGGWWDPFYDHEDWQRVLRTPSGRFEFPTALLRELDPTRAARRQPFSSAVAETEAAARGLPLTLLLFEPLPIAGGTGAELPFLQELLDPGLEERWETWAELHPETAEPLGIEDRETVEITSQESSIRARVRLTPRVMPGVVAVPVGLGKRGGGRWARNRGANPLRLVDPRRERLSGLPDLGSVRVRVSRLSPGARRQGHQRS